MKPILPYLFLFFLTACGSGRVALKHENFDVAVRRSAERLKRKPSDTKARMVLREAYRRAHDQHQNVILRLSRQTDEPFRWEKVVAEYQKLQQLAEQALACRNCESLLGGYPVDYRQRLTETRELAAAERFALAEEAFVYRETNRQAARDAYENFLKADDWVTNYRQARQRAEEVLPYAILRVVVEPLTPSRWLSPGDEQRLQKLIFRELARQQPPSLFVRYYMPGVTPEPERHPDHVVQMAVSNYDPYDVSESSSCQTVESTQEYKVGTKKINDSTTVDVKEKVKGTLTTHKRQVRADLYIDIRSLDARSGQVLWADRIWETESWSDEWETFSGDDRALNGRSLKSASLFMPSRWSMLSDLISSTPGSVRGQLRQKYKSF